jgi:hypothetical protein
MDRKPGHYLGTEIDERWWKRYTRDGFFARGNGVFWYDSEAFYFLRFLTKNPLMIVFRDIEGFQLDSWHAGRWVWRRRAIKFKWHHLGQDLSSGFVLTQTEAQARQLIELLRELCDSS